MNYLALFEASGGSMTRSFTSYPYILLACEVVKGASGAAVVALWEFLTGRGRDLETR